MSVSQVTLRHSRRAEKHGPCTSVFRGTAGDVQGALDWAADGVATSFADRMLGVLATRGHDVRERVLWRVIRSPADRERETRVPGGAVGGLTLTGLRSTWQRPGNRSPIQGLYLVGAATHPGPGLAFAARSATITADLIGRAT